MWETVQNTLDGMQSALEEAGGAVGLSAIYLAGLLALWYGKGSHRVAMRELFWYAFLALLVAITPMGRYVALLLPLTPIVLRLAAEATPGIGDARGCVTFAAAVAALLLLAGTSSFSPRGLELAGTREEIPMAERDALALVVRCMEERGMEDAMLLAPDEVMDYARMYSARIRLPYERSLRGEEQDPQYYLMYEHWHYELHDRMLQAQVYPEEVAGLAYAHDCDLLLLAKEPFLAEGRILPDGVGGYRFYAGTGEYALYYAVPWVRPGGGAVVIGGSRWQSR